MAYALGLPDALRRRGLTVEVVPGWETRSAGSFNPKGAVAHWTAGPRGATGRPSLNVVINGRPGLNGPLCNVYGARDGTAVVVSAGRANHAGVGGWRGLVGNSAVFGTEMEGADAADFTAEQRWAYPRIHAAYCDLGRFGPEMNCGHSEWATPQGRKTDINGYTPDTLRRDIAAVLAGDDDMTPDQDAMLRFLYNRIAGRDVQRWMKQNPDGSPIITGPDDPEGWPARSVDIADILTLTGVVSGGDAAVLAHVDAGSAADADRDARLAAQLGALGTDPAAIVEALRAGLGDDFARQVVAELGKRLAG